MWNVNTGLIQQICGIIVMVQAFTSNSENVILLNVNVLRKLRKVFEYFSQNSEWCATLPWTVQAIGAGLNIYSQCQT